MTDQSYFVAQAQSTGHPIADLSRRLTERVRQRRLRRGLKKIAELDAHILHDIGVTRQEAQRISGLPLSVDASTELYNSSLHGSRNNRGQ
ncbi:MAG: DUF1127 domain-containing protein [Boseongicola sp.]|nr:MAG: DUF1127 domain-containing protein [Boseongicola sp.]